MGPGEATRCLVWVNTRPNMRPCAAAQRPARRWRRGGGVGATRSETEHPEPLAANQVVRVDRLHLAEIGDRLGAAALLSIGEAAVVVGLEVGRIELDCLGEIRNRAVIITLCRVGFAT